MKKTKLHKILFYFLLGIIVTGTVALILYEKDHNTKTLAVDNSVRKEYVYPIGLPAGIYLKTNGVMVIDTVTIENKQGELINPSNGKIKAGDYITKFNDISVGNKAKLQYLIENNKEKEITLSLISKNVSKTVQIKPVENKEGNYQVGLWIRDDMQSIGTVSFLTENNQFFSLGHGICDVDTGKLLSSNEGFMYRANIWGVKKGEAGNPGGLCGSIDYSEEEKIGKITLNTESGIWGQMTSDNIIALKSEKMEVARGDSVQSGKAKIKLIFQGESQYYDIEIIHVDSSLEEKNMVLKITDEKLLKKTNGIVQGMSGCPIIQKNKVVGILTHVMVNHPNYGYGILIDKISG